MRLSPRETEKLMIVVAGDLARRRLERGLKLNHPEAVAYITAAIYEAARDGKTVVECMDYGTTLLTEDQVMEGVAAMIPTVALEATFPDGTKLVTVHEPIRPAKGAEASVDNVPGELITSGDEITINEGGYTIEMHVKNTGDRPVQVGSHYHFAEVNPALSFDRDKAVGFRLNIPAGTSARFEPGDERTVSLVAYRGTRDVYGFRGEFNRNVGPVVGA